MSYCACTTIRDQNIKLHAHKLPSGWSRLFNSLFLEFSGRLTEFIHRLGVGVLRDFNKLKADSQSKNIQAWTPVVAEILEGYCRFDRQDVSHFILSHPKQSL